MKRTVWLTKEEIAVLDRPTKGKGGFQGLINGFKDRLDRKTGELHLSADDMKKIKSYASEFGDGGFQNRLHKIFGRELGLGPDGNL